MLAALFGTGLALAQSTGTSSGAGAFAWPDGKRAAISLTFDDARESQVTSGVPLFGEYGIRVTFYLSPGNIGGPSGVQLELEEGEFFVMGDNRRVSSDSRIWGALPEENIIGHVLVRLFPISTLEILPGDATYSEIQSTAADPRM